MAKSKVKQEQYKPFLTKGFVITDHTGVSMKFFRSTQELAIQAAVDYHHMDWDELKQVCRCVPVEVREI